ncbi:MAG: hypothetical protein ACC655_00700 [Rhodothermia bacterium]
MDRIQTELKLTVSEASPLERRIAQIRSMQREFREQPVGGRFLPLKGLVYWFTASAFDRQAKVVEALLMLAEDLAEEIHRLELQFARSFGDDGTQEEEEGKPDQRPD